MGLFMSDAELMLLVESRKKSRLISSLLNLFLPGAGYIYCGRWILGIIAFAVMVPLYIVSLGIASLIFAPILIIDGALSAKRYNRRLVERLIKERAQLKREVAL